MTGEGGGRSGGDGLAASRSGETHRRPGPGRRALVVCAAIATGCWLALAAPLPTSAAVALEDRVAPQAALEQITRYRAAVEAEPSSLTARWKLLRWLHYLSEFTTAPDDQRDAAVDEAVALAEESVTVADEAVAGSGGDVDRSDAARVYFWSAIVWGARGQRVGLLTIVREGVANRIHENATRAVELDPTIERGGAFRLLSRLHADLPRVPFVTGWVDRDQALPLAERGLAIAPDDPGNQLVMALALLDRDAERRDEAVALLERVAGLTPRPALRAEDRAIARQAADRLEAIARD